VANLDGLLLPGSDSDVDPLRYGEEPHRGLGEVQPLKDKTDLLTIAAAERKRIPIFAICFGMQILNVARGGTLIQDIPAQKPDAIKHEQGLPRDRASHRIRLKSDSLVGALAASEVAMVNSFHHQAVEHVGRELVETAWAGDGLIEAVEDPRRDRFVVGVQWHPEINWAKDPLSQRLFERFIEACRERRLARETEWESVYAEIGKS